MEHTAHHPIDAAGQPVADGAARHRDTNGRRWAFALLAGAVFHVGQGARAEVPATATPAQDAEAPGGPENELPQRQQHATPPMAPVEAVGTASVDAPEPIDVFDDGALDFEKRLRIPSWNRYRFMLRLPAGTTRLRLAKSARGTAMISSVLVQEPVMGAPACRDAVVVEAFKPLGYTCDDGEQCQSGYCGLDNAGTSFLHIEERLTGFSCSKCEEDRDCGSGSVCALMLDGAWGSYLGCDGIGQVTSGEPCMGDWQCELGPCINRCPECVADEDCGTDAVCGRDPLHGHPACVEFGSLDLDAACTTDPECASEHCCAIPGRGSGQTCGECCTRDDCGDDLICGVATSEGARRYRVCSERRTRRVGEACVVDEECRDGECCGGLCSACCNGAGCRLGHCKVAEYEVAPVAAPFQCGPREGERPAGGACTDDRDCASAACRGFALTCSWRCGPDCVSDDKQRCLRYAVIAGHCE